LETLVPFKNCSSFQTLLSVSSVISLKIRTQFLRCCWLTRRCSVCKSSISEITVWKTRKSV